MGHSRKPRKDNTMQIDYDLLFEQRMALIDVMVQGAVPTDEQRGLLDGLVFLLDHIQDEGEDAGLWEHPSG